MITVTVADVLQDAMPDAYFSSVHCIYIVRDYKRVLYVGKAERQSTYARLLQHMAATSDAKYRGLELSPSELGRMIQSNAPASHRWQVDLLTLGDCQALASTGEDQLATVDQAERWLIKKYAPLLNRTNIAGPGVCPRITRRRANEVKALPRFADEYMASVSQNRKTRDTYRYGLQRFQQFAENVGLAMHGTPLQPSRLYRDVLIDFVSWLHHGGAKNNTILTFVAVVRQYILWLQANSSGPLDLRVAEMELALEQMSGPHLRNIRPEHRRADDTVGQLLKYFADLANSRFPITPRGRRQKLACLRNHAIVQTLYSTAGRAGEVATLPRSLFERARRVATETQDGQIAQPVAIDVAGKGGKTRPIFLTLDAQKAIMTYLLARDAAATTQVASGRRDEADALFVRHDRAAACAISTKTVWQIVNAAAKKVFGTDAKGRPLRRVGPQDFRHLRAQDLFDKGMPLDTLQAMLGHSSVLTTRHMYGDYPSRERIADEISRFGRKATDTSDSQ